MKQFVCVIFVALAVSSSALPGQLPGDKPELPGGKQSTGWGWAWVPTTPPGTTTPVTTTPVVVGNLCIPVYNTLDTCTTQSSQQVSSLVGLYLGLGLGLDLDLKKKEEVAAGGRDLITLDVFLSGLSLFSSCMWSSVYNAGYPVESSLLDLWVAVNLKSNSTLIQ